MSPRPQCPGAPLMTQDLASSEAAPPGGGVYTWTRTGADGGRQEGRGQMVSSPLLPLGATPNIACPRGLSGEALPGHARPLCVWEGRGQRGPLLCFTFRPTQLWHSQNFTPSAGAPGQKSPPRLWFVGSPKEDRAGSWRKAWLPCAQPAGKVSRQLGGSVRETDGEQAEPGFVQGTVSVRLQVRASMAGLTLALILWTSCGEHTPLSHTGSPGQRAHTQAKWFWF